LLGGYRPMRAVVQRVSKAVVRCEGEVVAEIGRGLVALVGIGQMDDEEDAEYIASKLATLRVFEDEEGRMSKSPLDLGLSVLIVPNFTLYGDCRKGRRPDFSFAMPRARAEPLFRAVVERTREHGVNAVSAPFGARMEVELINEGPVTILLDSKKLF